ncbi:acyltransferase [Modestobacter sp. SYSU DS0511]
MRLDWSWGTIRAVSKLPARLKWEILKRRHGTSGAARALGVTVGQDCRMISCEVRSEPWLLTVGDRVTVSSEVLFITHDGTGWLFSDEAGRRYRYAPIRVGSDCFIGARSIIMPGVEIGDRSIVAAGSVVVRSVPPGSIVGGNPARIIGSFDEFEARVLKTWPRGSDRLGGTYRQQVDSIAETSFRPHMHP